MRVQVQHLTKKGAAMRGRLKKAVRDIVLRDGIEGLAVAAVCAEAGATRTSFYGHFPDMTAALQEVGADVADELAAIYDAPGPARAGVERLAACLASLCREPPALLTALGPHAGAALAVIAEEAEHDLSATREVVFEDGEIAPICASVARAVLARSATDWSDDERAALLAAWLRMTGLSPARAESLARRALQ